MTLWFWVWVAASGGFIVGFLVCAVLSSNQPLPDEDPFAYVNLPRHDDPPPAPWEGKAPKP